MESDYTIVEAGFSDIDRAVEIRLRLQDHIGEKNAYLWGISDKKAPNLKKLYHNSIENEESCLLVIRESEDQTIVGMGLGRILYNEEYVPGRFGRIDEIWIEPNHRKKGLCTKIVSKMLKFFKSNNIDDLTLDYTIGNVEAEIVWKKMGFHPVLTIANAKISEMEHQLIE